MNYKYILKSSENKISCIENKLFKSLYIIIIFLLLCALIIVSFEWKLYPDYDTALFWVKELLETSKQISGIGIFTYLIFKYLNIKEKSTS